MTETVLDRTHAEMAAGEDDVSRLRFYQEIADAELFLLLESEPIGDDIRPRVFDLEAGRFVMAFDLEERLAAFTGEPAPYAALPGRIIAAALSGQETGLGLNLGVAPSGYLMSPDALHWLTETLGHMPDEAEARPVGFSAPTGLSRALLEALTIRLARFPGLAHRAFLAEASYLDGSRGYLLAFEGAGKMAQPALAKAVSETLVFSGIDAGELDVAFLEPGDRALSRLKTVGALITIPGVKTPQPVSPTAPGMDPKRPPKLR